MLEMQTQRAGAGAPALPFTEDVLPWLQAWRAEGLKAALVTLVGIEGTSPRPLGSQMAVCEDGRAAGVITGGCAQAAIILEAQSALADGRPRLVRYGVGSPYIDIKLPCGAGIDVYVDPTVGDGDVALVTDAVAARACAEMVIDLEAERTACRTGMHGQSQAERDGSRLIRRYAPAQRLVIAGKGPIAASLARLGAEAAFETVLLSPEPETLELGRAPSVAARPLMRADDFEADTLDAWTALVLLFHDHEWEPPILAKALQTPCGYIGALGSRRTHGERLDALRAMGCPDDQTARIHGPVGLAIGAKSPPAIAVAILAQIVGHQQADR